jgi:UDP-glucose 4-epimerase
MKVVVTGGAGFIGANLCRAFSEHPGIDQVVVVDDLSTGRSANVDGIEVSLLTGSILDADLLDAAFEGASSVVHLAARPSVPRSLADPMASHLVNATGTVQVLEAARRAGGVQVVVASSSSVYGANATLPKREDLPVSPVSPYAATKLATESYAIAWGRSFGMDVLPFRFFNVFGPLQAANHAYAAVVPAFISAALDGRPLTVHGDGQQTRDFTFVSSLTAVITEAVVRRRTSLSPVNLAFGGRFSLLEVIAVLEELIGRPLERDHTAPRAGDVRDSQADQSRLRSMFPDIVPVDLRSGLQMTVDWFRSVAADG